MNMKLMASSVAAGLMLMAGAVQADTASGGNVHFEGELVNAACAVNTASADQTVTLGQYRTASFTGVGATSGSVPFNIVLNDCDPSIFPTASVAFSGQVDAGDNTLLAITSGDNSTTASGVGIEILDTASQTVIPNGAPSTAQSLLEGTNTLHFSARYKATSATATPGQANADATFIMNYQ
ncbi:MULTISPECIES: type 1 fimbrial major subunit FimA [Kosakonia]|uniref:Type 1 fimbrial protein subunit FimA n=1 Tax=Kosakonia quasisacchari TaxID=2529380 RepID=A0A4R0HW67_9ENTR|nr:type 1 fimbrial major subunit FimA [Kosakonia quasisacchari]TCC14754.1 type 1 fimbrial protein subunit FimA [Kosakonia quasisacchari]